MTTITGKILMVGCGHMGFAMLKGWQSKDFDLYGVSPANKERDEQIKKAGITLWASDQDIPASFTPDLIILSIRPPLMEEVSRCYQRFAEKGSAFMSVAAGITIESLSAWLGEKTPIIRAMPNLPVSIGEGMTPYYANNHTDQKTIMLIDALLEQCGEKHRLEEESMIDLMTAISGSGTGYMFYLLECFQEVAQRVGLSAELARKACQQTMLGAALLAKSSDKTPSQWRKEIALPNGTTEAGLQCMIQQNALEELLYKAVQAAHQRSLALAKP